MLKSKRSKALLLFLNLLTCKQLRETERGYQTFLSVHSLISKERRNSNQSCALALPDKLLFLWSLGES